MSDAPEDSKVQAAAQTLEALHAQAEVKRAELREVLHDLTQARQDLVKDQTSDLVDANERLVIATQEAQMSAQAAHSDLDNLARSSQRDALTDTPNRTLMLGRLESAMRMAQRHGNHTALIFLDVDHFKKINDSLGHAAGDAVLQLVARRLESAVRNSDAVSRHGGDEFLVLLAEVSKVSDVAEIAQKILAEMALPVLLEGNNLQLSVSLGIAICPGDAQEALALISLADAAMYRSKQRGGGQYTFHSDPVGPDDTAP